MPVKLWSQPRRLDSRVTQVVGWLYPMEQSYLNWYMEEAYTGTAEAVELGSFFGRSTAALLDGLTRNQNPQARRKLLHVYDNFVWHEHYRADLPNGVGVGLKQWDSFEAEFETNVAPWKDRLQVHAGDIMTLGWHGAEIEFLFIDIMKSWDAAKIVVDTFFPSLIPGATVVHQDFKHFSTSWIHPIMYRLKEYMTPTYSIDGSFSLVFNCTRKIPADVCQWAGDYTSFTFSEINDSFDYSLQLMEEAPESNPDFWRNQMQAARFYTFIHYLRLVADEARRAALSVDAILQDAAAILNLVPPSHVAELRMRSEAEIAALKNLLVSAESTISKTDAEIADLRHQLMSAQSEPQWIAQHVRWYTLREALLRKVMKRLGVA